MSPRRAIRDPSAVAMDFTMVKPPPMGATPVPVELQEYPEPLPRHVVQKEGTRFAGFVSTSEWNDLQARRRKQRTRAAQSATIVGLQFLAEQLGSTTRAVALFTGLAARVVWLRRARRRRGPLVAALVAWASRASVLPDEVRAAARALVSPTPLSPLAGWSLLAAGAVAPHRAFVKIGSHVVLRFARIPKIRRILQRKWPIWGKHLLRNKMRAEVNSYRLAINEAWEVLEGTLPSDTLRAMREAERSLTARRGGGSFRDEIENENEIEDDDEADISPDASEGDAGEDASASSTGVHNSRAHSGGNDGKGKGRRAKRDLGDRTDASKKSIGGFFGKKKPPPENSGTHFGNVGRAVAGKVGYLGPLARVSGTFATRVGHASRVAAHAALVWTPSSLFGVLTGREFGAELCCPPRETLRLLRERLVSTSAGSSIDAIEAFTEAQRCAFLLQYNGDPKRAAAAMQRSVRWRETYAFLPRSRLREFEDVVFVHGKRHAYTGGVHLVLRLSEIHRIQSELGYDAVVAAIVSHVEQQWLKLGVSGKTGDHPGKLRGRLVALVDCRGIAPGTFPASLVATTLVTLDLNYPELAAEVHVVNVWWLVKRLLTTLLEATSASTRRRVRVYRGDDTGFEKLGIRFASHALPACFPGGKCGCRQCRRLARRDASFGNQTGTNSTTQMFQHGGLLGRYYRWEQMSSAQRRQYVRHLSFYYVGLFTFWPVHIFRLNAHPFLVGIIRTRAFASEFLKKLRRGDPLCVFAATVAAFTSLAFVVASLAWWAEFGGALLIQSARHPPRTWEEAWKMHGLFKRSIGASLEGSLGLDRGTLGGYDLTVTEDGGWLGSRDEL